MPRATTAARWLAPFLLLTAFGCKSPELAGGWRDREIHVDGDVDDWPGMSTYFDQERVRIAVRNDAEYLYLGLSSTHPAVLGRALLAGLTVWFDPKGGEARTTGIRFPLGVREMDFDIGAEGHGFSPAELLQRYRSSTVEYRLLEGADASRLVKQGEAPGVEVAMNGRNDTFTYELKVPLTSLGEGGFAVGAQPGDEISVGFEIPKPPKDVFVRGAKRDFERFEDPEFDPDSSRVDPEDPSGAPGGAPPGMRRGEDGRGDGFGRRRAEVEPLDLWARVKLASAPTAAR